ncbi:MAG: hypothetical protein WCE21_01610 [Candidatus Babeliales bacterium]
MWLSSKKAVEAIHAEAVTVLDVLIHTALIGGMFLTHTSVTTLLPHCYALVMQAIKHYLEAEAAPAQLTIFVYCPSEWVPSLNTIILFLGVVWALLTYRQHLSKSVQHTLLLLWSVLFRLMVISLVCFAVLVTIVGGYYAIELVALSKQQGPSGSVLLHPLKYLLKLTGSYDTVKEMWAKIFRLPKAQLLFDQINEWSLVLWYICHIASTFATVRVVMLLRRRLKQAEKPQKAIE